MDLPSFLYGWLAGAGLLSVVAILFIRSTARQARERLGDKRAELERLDVERRALLDKEDRLEEEMATLKLTVAETQATLRNERETSREKLQLLDEAKENLRREFENLAHRIFEEKSAKITGQNIERLKELLDPLKSQIGDFRKRVDDVYDKEGRERSTLLLEIKQLKDLNNRISKEATDLTLALKGESKTRGNWGELILERVLEQSGLVRGREYDTQVFLKDKFGGSQSRYPDVVIHLPESRDVIVDAKVTLNAYERFVNGATPEQKQAALKEHVEAVRLHIKGLSAKNYQDLEGIKPMELVLMCIPNEPAFIAAVSEDARLHEDAMGQHVVLVGPTTLLLTLRIIGSMWRTEYQNRNAMEIASRGQLLYEKFVGFVEDLQAVGAAIEQAGEAYENALKKLSSGSGNLVGQAEKLVQLGVKASRKLPLAAAEEDSAEPPGSTLIT